MVTVKLNENCLTPDGWTKVSDTEFTKVYSNNGKYSVTFSDLAGNTVVAKFEVKRIDKVAPEAEVTTSNNGLPTNQDVVVTLKANEAIYKPTGWTEVTTNKEKEFTKVYSENTTDSVVITDKAGNTSTINFEVKGIDKVSPVIESITKSNNDKSTNQDVVVTVKLNENCLTPDGWTKVSDTEYTKVYSNNGKYSVTFSDLAGNTVVAKFEVKRIDKVAPEAEVTTSNNGLPTNQDVVVTLKANEAIYKPTGWTEVTTNKEKEFTKVYSENTTDSVVITDKAGNTSTINFEVKDIDKVAPEMTSLRMLGTKLYKENGNYVWYVKNNETIYVYVTFADKLYTNPTITLNNSKSVTAYLAKEDNNSFIYAGAFKLTDGDGLQDGYVSFVVQGYSDEAGNVGVTLTNEDITLDSQKYVIIDRTPVSINLSEGTIGNNFYSKINVKLYDAYGVNKVKVNDTLLPHTGYYVDINDGHAYTFIEGSNTIVAEDKAGNVTTVTYIKDTVAPEVSVKSVVGKDPHYSQISFKLYDNNAIDYFVLNGTKYDRTDAMWSDANYQNIKDSLVDGDNTLVLYDAAGNSTEYNFVLDLVAPTITVKDTSESVNGIYTKISFKLGDDHLIDKFQINESKIVDVTDNNLGDANYHAIKNSLKEGNNTITLYDTAGNSTVFNFKYTSGTVVSNLDTFRNAIANGGVVYLANDISLSTQYDITADTTLTGANILRDSDYTGSLFKVSKGTTLNIKDIEVDSNNQ